jgi:hypothetical protein
MNPQQLENLAALPARRNRPVRRLKVAHRLRPLPRRRIGADKGIGRRVRGVRGRVRVRGLALRGPVVYVPVVFVEQLVVLRQEGRGQRRQVGLGKRRQEQVRLEGAAFSRLVCGN